MQCYSPPSQCIEHLSRAWEGSSCRLLGGTKCSSSMDLYLSTPAQAHRRCADDGSHGIAPQIARSATGEPSVGNERADLRLTFLISPRSRSAQFSCCTRRGLQPCCMEFFSEFHRLTVQNFWSALLPFPHFLQSVSKCSSITSIVLRTF